jgi:TrpR-related protein YerC/YecD
MVKLVLGKDQKLLVDSFYKARTKKDLALFVQDLLTDEEILDFAQRVKIANYILADKTYEEIEKLMPVSSSTISKIGQVIKFGKGGFKLLKTSKKSK